jgi:hypothetical protein
VSGLKKTLEEKKNSIELLKFLFSQVYMRSRPKFYSEKDMRLVDESVQTLQDSVRRLTQNLRGMVKLFLKLLESTVKGSVTSSKEPPQVKIQERKN